MALQDSNHLGFPGKYRDYCKGNLSKKLLKDCIVCSLSINSYMCAIAICTYTCTQI